MLFERTLVIGVGAIGASFARAARENGLTGHISGYGRVEATLKKAREKGIIDDYSPDLAVLSSRVDLILLASPVGTFLDLVSTLAPSLKKGAIVTDAGSVKGGMVYAIERMMPQGTHYIGSHPMAGTEQTGLEASTATLFKGADCIITPTKDTDPTAFSRVMELWTGIGARIKILTPELHDEIVSAISHLPHLLASTLVNTIGDINEGFMEYSGNGFKDVTRIAMGSPAVWKDIFLQNKDNILKHIEVFKKRLDGMAQYIKESDIERIVADLSTAQSVRKTVKGRRRQL